MRVGVVFEPSRPEVGGGDTFQRDVLGAFLQLRRESSHDFVVFGPRHLDLPRGVESVTIGYSTPERAVSKLSRIARRVARTATAGGDFGTDPRVERILLGAGVEMLWYLTPYTPTMELPFITVVWDLQHRLQPHFPEVSADGVWSERERAISEKLRRAAVVVAGTQAGKAEIARFYGVPDERIRILPHPTPRFALEAPAQDDDSILARHGLRRGFLFYPAQFWPHKNHVGLLLALKELRDHHGLALDLVLVGADQGTLAAVTTLAAELGLQRQVHLLGFVPREELPALYRGALALTYVTFFGPENLPPLEAFALGCPVVASDVAGAREQLGDAALLVDPRRPAQIAQAVQSLVNDSALRDRLTRSGMQRARRWTGLEYVRGIFAVLDEYEPVVRCWRKSPSVLDGRCSDHGSTRSPATTHNP
jgi:glycosyltransferase involved in cell wall biosynthesis